MMLRMKTKENIIPDHNPDINNWRIWIRKIKCVIKFNILSTRYQ